MNVAQRFENGKNYLDKTVKRGYLRKDEENLILIMLSVKALVEGRNVKGLRTDGPVWEKWQESGIITKEQIKNLKMANTYLSKFANDVIANNLDSKSKSKLLKKAASFEFRMVDDYTVKKLHQMVNARKEMNLTMEEWYTMVDGTLFANCKGCKNDRNTCALRDFYEDKFVPPVIELGRTDEISCTCEYSY